MKILQARNPVLTEDGQIDLEVLFEELSPEWIPFTASPNDVEPHGVELYNNAVAGMYGTVAPYVPPVYTAEEQAEIDLAEAKQVRADAVDAIVVTVDGMVFDGDEDAQRRMTVAVSTAMSRADRVNSALKRAWELELQSNPNAPEPEYDNYLDYTTTWVLADNTIVTVTIAQLSHACELAGTAQTDLWTVPYE